jgi:hypothetical protein
LSNIGISLPHTISKNIMEKLTKETREILISYLEIARLELQLQEKIISKATEFKQSNKVDYVLLECKIAEIKSILYDGQFEFISRF